LITCAPEDGELKAQLVRHLHVLVHATDIKVWTTDQVRGGEDWRQMGDAALGQADVVLLLISSDFLASEVLQNQEIPKLFQRHEHDGLKVIPVLIRSCLWQMHPWIGTFKPLPASAKPIASFQGDERDKAMTEVAAAIAEHAGERSRGRSRVADSRARSSSPGAEAAPPETAISAPVSPNGGDGEAAERVESLLERVGRLRPCLRDGRWKRISNAAPLAVTERWAQVLQELPHDDGAVEPIIATMWQEAVRLRCVPPIPALNRRLDRHALTEFCREKRDFWTCLPQSEALSIGPEAYAREATFAWRSGAWDKDQPLAGPLFELLWDVLYDCYVSEADPMSLGGFDPRWWGAAGGTPDECRPFCFPWPSANLHTFYEHHRLARKWNQMYAKARAVHRTLPDDTGTIDALAFAYLRCHHQLWHKNERAVWKTSVSASDWTMEVSHFERHGTDNSYAREQPFARWSRAVPLLAAPESGLSRHAAAAILDAVKLDDDNRVYLRELRLRRARMACPGEAPAVTLATIDAAWLAHPWIERINEQAGVSPRGASPEA
jgi:hypothetical protein